VIGVVLTPTAWGYDCLTKGEWDPDCGSTCIAEIVPSGGMTWHVVGDFTADQEAAINRGANAWDAGSGEVLRGAEWDYVRGSDESFIALDGEPDVITEPDSWFPSSDMIAATMYYFGGAEGCGAWDDAVIVFNEDDDWDALELPNRAAEDYYSMECAAAHEWGHVLGLDHEDDGVATMVSTYPPACDAGNKLRIGEDDYNALRTYQPDSSTGDNVYLAKFNVYDSSGPMYLQEVWDNSPVTRDPLTEEYVRGHWRACQGETYAVSFLIEPILASTTSTTTTLYGVDVEWWLAPGGQSCFNVYGVMIGDMTGNLTVGAPTELVCPDDWVVPAAQATGDYKVCARIDPGDEVSETSEIDQVVVSDRVFHIYDPEEDPGLCP
jgi:hypothetical protein